MADMSLKRKFFFSFLSALVLSFITILVSEIGVRVIGKYDTSGNFVVNGFRVKPYRVQSGEVLSARMDRYISESSKGNVWQVYDPLIGWTRPRGIKGYNSQGIRTSTQGAIEYSTQTRRDKLRIALFGDSFTNSSEVTYEESWGYQLEKFLGDAGIDVEVLNFGVGGYGMDQAFLRWESEGKSFSPDIVIFGLQLENIKRNMNLYRPFYVANSDITLTKPRFLLESNDLESDGLRLINVPTVAPEAIPDLVENFDAWEFAGHEYFYQAEDYQDRIWRKSKLIATAAEIASRLRHNFEETDIEEFQSLDKEPGQLTYAILRAFKNSVASTGGEFIMVHLPVVGELKARSNGREPGKSELVEKLKECCVVIDTETDLLQDANASSIESLFAPGRHYSATANQVIARSISQFLASRLSQNRKTD